MLAEFVDRLVSLARGSDGIERVVDERLRKVFVRQGSEHTVVDFPVDPRSSVIRSLPDFIEAVKDESIATDPEIYHNDYEVVLVCDRQKRDEMVTMPLECSEKFVTITRMDSSTSKDQKSWIKTFRFDLPSSGADKLIQAIRKVNFSRKSDGSSNVQHGKESLGRSVEAAVQQADEIPDTVNVTVPVYKNMGVQSLSTYAIALGIHIDMEREGFVIAPLADQVTTAVKLAQGSLGKALRKETDAPVFYGDWRKKA